MTQLPPEHPNSVSPAQSESQPVDAARPSTVVAAAVLTWIGAGIAGTGSLLMMMSASMIDGSSFLMDDDVGRMMRDMMRREGMGDAEVDQAQNLILTLGIGGLAWCLIASALALLMMKRKNWARVLLTISATAAALVSLISFLAVFPILFALAAISAIVLMFKREANNWFRDNSVLNQA